MTIDCERETNHIIQYFPNVEIALYDDENCSHTRIAKNYVNSIIRIGTKDDSLNKELQYKQKYIRTLINCLKGNRMLCLLIEDDILFLHEKWYSHELLVYNTISKFSNDLCFTDCSKQGFFINTGITGNKSLCRIYTKENLKEFIECLKTDYSEKPIDLAIATCQEKLSICQRRVLLVQHSGRKSELGHT